MIIDLKIKTEEGKRQVEVKHSDSWTCVVLKSEICLRLESEVVKLTKQLEQLKLLKFEKSSDLLTEMFGKKC